MQVVNCTQLLTTVALSAVACLAAAQDLPTGAARFTPTELNFVATKNEPVVVQISGTGPTGVKYVDPAHEPKKQ
jgi:hypothetical protein